jgi:hypothetical protein
VAAVVIVDSGGAALALYAFMQAEGELTEETVSTIGGHAAQLGDAFTIIKKTTPELQKIKDANQAAGGTLLHFFKLSESDAHEDSDFEADSEQGNDLSAFLLKARRDMRYVRYVRYMYVARRLHVRYLHVTYVTCVTHLPPPGDGLESHLPTLPTLPTLQTLQTLHTFQAMVSNLIYRRYRRYQRYRRYRRYTPSRRWSRISSTSRRPRPVLVAPSRELPRAARVQR